MGEQGGKKAGMGSRSRSKIWHRDVMNDVEGVLRVIDLRLEQELHCAHGKPSKIL
jgi:hypothetical protein